MLCHVNIMQFHEETLTFGNNIKDNLPWQTVYNKPIRKIVICIQKISIEG